MTSSGCGWSQLLLRLHWHFPAEMIQICWRCLSGTAICWNGKQCSDSAGEGGSSKLATDALCSITQANSRIKGEVSKEKLHMLRQPGMRGGERLGHEQVAPISQSRLVNVYENIWLKPCNCNRCEEQLTKFTTNTEEWIHTEGHLIGHTINGGPVLSNVRARGVGQVGSRVLCNACCCLPSLLCLLWLSAAVCRPSGWPLCSCWVCMC